MKTHKHDERLRRLESQRETPIDGDRDIATILASARGKPPSPPTQSLAQLKAIVADRRSSPLAKRMARGNIVTNHFVGGPEQVRERICAAIAHAEGAELLKLQKFMECRFPGADENFHDLC